MDSIELLSANYLFRDLEPAVIQQIADMVHIKDCENGEILFLKGDPGDSLFGVLDGEIRITSTSINGRETVLNHMTQGEIFGEIAMLDGAARSADAVACSKGTRLMQLRRAQFLPFLEEHPKTILHMMELLCERVRWISERVEDFSFLDVSGRLAKLILAEAERQQDTDEDGNACANLPPQGEIAKMIGTSRVSVNKHLQVWKRDGLIDNVRGRITVHDEDALEDIVNTDPYE